MNSPFKQRLIRAAQYLQPFFLTQDQISKVMDVIAAEIESGLSKDVKVQMKGSLKMVPSYVREMPNGTETGKYLALETGSYNIRTVLYTLKDGKINLVNSETFRIPEEIFKGSGKNLLYFHGKCIKKFIDTNNLSKETLPMGWTVGYPTENTSVKVARFLTFNKELSSFVLDLKGKEADALLEEALVAHNVMNVHLEAICNDTVGTLLTGALSDRNVALGVIIATGVNCCYIEKITNIEKWVESTHRSTSDEVVVNTEMGNLGQNGCLSFVQTEIDTEIDKDSLIPGEMIFEKMAAGMTLGEIVRRIILKFVSSRIMFINEKLSVKLRTPYTFNAKHISQIHSDGQGIYTSTRNVLREMGILTASDTDCEILKLVCCVVVDRSCQLMALAIAALIKRMQRIKTTIAIDGSLYRCHPTYKQMLESKVCKLLPPLCDIDYVLANDGGTVGAAVLAAVEDRLFSRRQQQRLQQI